MKFHSSCPTTMFWAALLVVIGAAGWLAADWQDMSAWVRFAISLIGLNALFVVVPIWRGRRSQW